MKRIFIVHGWSGRPDAGWFVWLNKKLSAKGFKVYANRMPNPDYPEIGQWVSYLKSIVEKPDKDTYFIGHSIGCQAIIRYIESLPEKTKIGGAIFIAGWFTLQNLETKEEKEVSETWLKTPINFSNVKSKIGKVVSLLSEDDPFVPVLENSKIFREKLGAKVIVENNKGHYIENETKEIPLVLKEILAIIQ